MPLEKLLDDLKAQLAHLETAGTAKGTEQVVVAVKPPGGARGPRFLLDGFAGREFIRMNSNSYLGLSLRHELIEAEEQAAHAYGVGPGAVRFISGTYEPHVKLEQALAEFHGRPAAMVAGSAYTAVAGVLFSFSTPETVLVSDELNHNCIVNGMKLAPHKARKVYGHLDLRALEQQLEESLGQAEAAPVVTDGVFSRRGGHAPVDRMAELCRKYDPRFPRGCVLIVDDSHGVGGFGTTGRGTEEVTGGRADVLIGTLGKAMGVNGGFNAPGNPGVPGRPQRKPIF